MVVEVELVMFTVSVVVWIAVRVNTTDEVVVVETVTVDVGVGLDGGNTVVREVTVVVRVIVFVEGWRVERWVWVRVSTVPVARMVRQETSPG